MRTTGARPEYLPGRGLLALLDAIAWPAAWVIALSAIPFDTGLIGTFVKTILVLAMMRRCERALFRNARYRFSTLRWGAFAAGLVA